MQHFEAGPAQALKPELNELARFQPGEEGSSCNTPVARMSCDLKVVSLNPAWRRVFSFSLSLSFSVSPSLSFISMSVKRPSRWRNAAAFH